MVESVGIRTVEKRRQEPKSRRIYFYLMNMYLFASLSAGDSMRVIGSKYVAAPDSSNLHTMSEVSPDFPSNLITDC